MNVWWLWFIQAVCCWFFVAGHPSTYFLNKEKLESLTGRTVVALQKVSKFYKDNFDKVNLDSIFGLRAAEGALYNLIHEHKTNPYFNDEKLRITIQKIYNEIHDAAVNSLEQFHQNGGSYFKSFEPVIDKRWYYQQSLRKVDQGLISQSLIHDDIDEEISDGCMKDLMGTQMNQNQGCVISDNCWTMMYPKGAIGYLLTHQALFFIIADVSGCLPVVKRRLEEPFDDILTLFGSNIFSQMNRIADRGFPVGLQDLFLEQSLFCKWLGIDSCFSTEWLDTVLQWQDSSGCIKERRNFSTARKLLRESRLEDGCLSHTTGLFIAFLSHSVHWLVTENATGNITLGAVQDYSP